MAKQPIVQHGYQHLNQQRRSYRKKKPSLTFHDHSTSMTEPMPSTLLMQSQTSPAPYGYSNVNASALQPMISPEMHRLSPILAENKNQNNQMQKNSHKYPPLVSVVSSSSLTSNNQNYSLSPSNNDIGIVLVNQYSNSTDSTTNTNPMSSSTFTTFQPINMHQYQNNKTNDPHIINHNSNNNNSNYNNNNKITKLDLKKVFKNDIRCFNAWIACCHEQNTNFAYFRSLYPILCDFFRDETHSNRVPSRYDMRYIFSKYGAIHIQGNRKKTVKQSINNNSNNNTNNNQVLVIELNCFLHFWNWFKASFDIVIEMMSLWDSGPNHTTQINLFCNRQECESLLMKFPAGMYSMHIYIIHVFDCLYVMFCIYNKKRHIFFEIIVHD